MSDSKQRYSEHVEDQIRAGKWYSTGTENLPHWFWGDLRILGDWEENPESGNKERFQLIFAKRMFRKPTVKLTRWTLESVTNVVLTLEETTSFIDLIPTLRVLIQEQIEINNDYFAKQKEAAKWWP